MGHVVGCSSYLTAVEQVGRSWIGSWGSCDPLQSAVFCCYPLLESAGCYFGWLVIIGVYHALVSGGDALMVHWFQRLVVVEKEWWSYE